MAQRVSNEEIADAYRMTGSIWKAARRLGLVGQSVWERLRAMGHPIQSANWTKDELGELRRLAGTTTIAEISRIVGRSYAGVACKLSRLGIRGLSPRDIKKRPGLSDAEAIDLMNVIEGDPRPFTRVCRSRGIDVGTFVGTIQKAAPARWATYISVRSQIRPRPCVYCGLEFTPTNGKQRACSRKCQGAKLTDDRYFSGNRRKAIGMVEGVCQLCGDANPRHLSAHHMLGKENDPGNDHLIALCSGCHQIVGILAGRAFTDSEDGWENLITLVMARRMAKSAPGKAGCHASVDLEWLSDDDVEQTEAAPCSR